MIKPSAPLKSKIELAIRRIEAQVQYLQSAQSRFTDRDKYLSAGEAQEYGLIDEVVEPMKKAAAE